MLGWWSRRNQSAPPRRGTRQSCASPEALECRALLSAQPVGPEFTLAASAPGDQTAPAVAALADAGYVAVWQSEGAPGTTGPRLWAHLLDAAGAPRGAPFPVTQPTTLDQARPVVAADARGRFTVAWQTRLPGAVDWDIYARRFEATGTPLGDEFRVHAVEASNQASPSVAADASGNITVAWVDLNHDGDTWGVFARRFGPDGAPLGGDFQVNATAELTQTGPAVAADAAGDVMIAWASSLDRELPVWGVFAQRFGPDGARAGGEFEVTEARTAHVPVPAVAAAGGGAFVVAWPGHAPSPGGDGLGVHARQYRADGAPRGAGFLVSANHAPGQPSRPALAAGGGGEFVVAWSGVGDGDTGLDAFAREYGGPSGGARGPDFRLNTVTTAGDQAAPALALKPGGGGAFVAAWQGRSSDGPEAAGDWDLFGQNFLAGAANAPPSHAPVPATVVPEDAPDTVVDLYALVSDDADADAVLTYEIVANTNPALFTSASIEVAPDSGTLRLDYAPDASGTARVDVRVTDTGGLSTVLEFGVTVEPVNDAPVNTVPPAQQTFAGVPLVFSAGNGNRVSVGDADAGEGPLRVTLAATGGTVTLATAAGLTFTGGDGDGDGAMSFAGAPGAINAAMNGMRFDPDAGFTGTATVAVTTDDEGRSGSGGAATDADVIDISVVVRPPPPLITIGDATVTEPDGGATADAAFTVALSEARPYPVTVRYATQDGAPGVAAGVATAPADYAAASGTLTFAPGETAKTIVVAVAGDALDEVDEGFSVVLSAPTDAELERAAAAGLVVDNDPMPSLSVGDATVAEGGSGESTTVTFTVTLSAPSGQFIRTIYRPILGTTATRGADFQATADFVDFLPGETEKTVTATVIGDAIDEPDETFELLFGYSGQINYAFKDGDAIGTIVDDDPAPAVSIGDVAVAEGDAEEGQLATLAVTLSAASGQPVSMNYRTADDTAAGPGDYEPAAGTLTFLPGETSKTVQVRVRGDRLDEADEESLNVFLDRLQNATFADSRGRVIVRDDDAPPSVSIEDAAVAEGSAGTTQATFTVRLTAASGRPVTVLFNTADGTAAAAPAGGGPGDYEAATGSVTFAPGETVKTITVLVRDDADVEQDETFAVVLSSPVNATVAGARWTAAFRERLAALGLGSARYGYSVPAGAAQLRELPWNDLSVIAIRFDADAVVEQGDLSFRGVRGTSYGFSAFAYDPKTKTAIWTLDRPLYAADKVVLDLDGDSGGVSLALGSGASGPALDGEWANGSDAFSSGDGTPGGDFEFRLNVLPGDVTSSGRVDSLDARQIRSRYNTSLSRPGGGAGSYSVLHDLTGDGRINALDLAVVRRNLFRSLPPGEPSGGDPAAQAAAATPATRDLLFRDTPVLP